jgi:hypothetical protein
MINIIKYVLFDFLDIHTALKCQEAFNYKLFNDEKIWEKKAHQYKQLLKAHNTWIDTVEQLSRKICKICSLIKGRFHKIYKYALCKKCLQIPQLKLISKSFIMRYYLFTDSELEKFDCFYRTNSQGKVIATLIKENVIKEVFCVKYSITMDEINMKINELQNSKKMEKIIKKQQEEQEKIKKIHKREQEREQLINERKHKLTTNLKKHKLEPYENNKICKEYIQGTCINDLDLIIK